MELAGRRAGRLALRAALRALRPDAVAALAVGGAVGAVIGFSFAVQDEPGGRRRRGSGGGPQPAPAAPTATSDVGAGLLPALDGDAARAITGGAPPSVHFRRVGDGFVAELDARTRNPSWVAERLTAASLAAAGAARRADHGFREDTALPPHLRPRLADYAGSGFDRGHLAAAANHSSSDAALDATFHLSNVSPQVGAGFNRDYWARLERWVRGLVGRGGGAGGDVLVVTGPLFLPEWRTARELAADAAASAAGRGDGDGGAGGGRRRRAKAGGGAPDDGPPASGGEGGWRFRHAAIGDALHWVSVPTHFFKVIALRPPPGGGGPVLVAAFVLPNAPIPPDTPLAEWVVPVAAVEAAAGLAFFRDVAPFRDVAGADAAFAGTDGGEAAAAARVRRSLTPRFPGPLPPDVAPALAAGGGARKAHAGVGSAGSGGRVRHLCDAVPCVLPDAQPWPATSGGGSGGDQ